jgi:thymidylate kinase
MTTKRIHPSSEPEARGWPRCIHLAGADGSGKTTQAKAILVRLEQQGIPVRQVWLRFPQLFCVPFLIYARVCGYSRYEVINGNEHGYWDFADSWIMVNVFPWALWLDTLLFSLVKIYLPLWRGNTVVCDRFITDIVADLLTGIEDPRFDERRVGRLFWALLPAGTRIVICDLETEVARQRSPELKGDRTHPRRRQVYLNLARRHNLPVISTLEPVETTTTRLLQVITSGASLWSASAELSASAESLSIEPLGSEEV